MSKVEIGLTNIFLQQKDKKYDTLPSSVKDIGYLFRLDDIQPSKNCSHDDDDDDENDDKDDNDEDDDDDDDEDLESTAIARELPSRPSPPKIITNTDTTREN